MQTEVVLRQHANRQDKGNLGSKAKGLIVVLRQLANRRDKGNLGSKATENGSLRSARKQDHRGRKENGILAIQRTKETGTKNCKNVQRNTRGKEEDGRRQYVGD